VAYGSPIFARIYSVLRFLSRQIVDASPEQALQEPYLFVLLGAHHHLAFQLDQAVEPPFTINDAVKYLLCMLKNLSAHTGLSDGGRC
jgi:hypothetical protein